MGTLDGELSMETHYEIIVPTVGTSDGRLRAHSKEGFIMIDVKVQNNPAELLGLHDFGVCEAEDEARA